MHIYIYLCTTWKRDYLNAFLFFVQKISGNVLMGVEHINQLKLTIGAKRFTEAYTTVNWLWRKIPTVPCEIFFPNTCRCAIDRVKV